MTPAWCTKPDPPESVNQEFWLGRKKMQELETKKTWKLQKTFLLLPKAKNAAFAAAADSTFLEVMKWSWASKTGLLPVIIEQSDTSAKRSLLISFYKMLLLVLLCQLHCSSLTVLKEVFFPIPDVSQRKSKKFYKALLSYKGKRSREKLVGKNVRNWKKEKSNMELWAEWCGRQIQQQIILNSIHTIVFFKRNKKKKYLEAERKHFCV